MTASTDFVPYATGSGANVEAQSTWVSDSVLTNGLSSGIVPSQKLNKAIRQPSFFAAAFTSWMAGQLNAAVLDDGIIANLSGQIGAAINAATASTYLTQSAAASTYATQVSLTALAAAIASTYAPIASPAFTGAPTAPTPSPGDNSTKLATTAYVYNNTLGHGQSWNDVTSSRAANTTYTNTHGRPIQLRIVCSDTSGASASLVLNGTLNMLLSTGSVSYYAYQVAEIIVPAGATYSLTSGANIQQWLELS